MKTLLPLLLAFAAIVAASTAVQAHQTIFRTVATLPGGNGNPDGPLLLDTAGNMYGVGQASTSTGGFSSIFRVTPEGALSILHQFTTPPVYQGEVPIGGLVNGPHGLLYGAVGLDGYKAWAEGCQKQCGTIYSITPEGDFKVLHQVDGNLEGKEISGTLVLGQNGNLYGMTYRGGTHNCGVLFEVTPTGSETVLYNFGESKTAGCNPAGGLVRQNNRTFYDATVHGGGPDSGIGFAFDPSSRILTTLHVFSHGTGDGEWPLGVSLDSQHNLFGQAQTGGIAAGALNGAVFRIGHNGVETVLHRFGATNPDGVGTSGIPVRNALGNLYGMTPAVLTGNCVCGYGTIFEIKPAKKTGTYTIVHRFVERQTPQGGVVEDRLGHMFGLTTDGHGGGTVYELIP